MGVKAAVLKRPLSASIFHGVAVFLVPGIARYNKFPEGFAVQGALADQLQCAVPFL